MSADGITTVLIKKEPTDESANDGDGVQENYEQKSLITELR